MVDESPSTVPVAPVNVPAVVWRYKWLLVGAFFVGAALGLGWSAMQSKSYVAEAQLILTDPRVSSVFTDNQQGIANAPRYVRNQADYIESDLVSARAAELLGGDATLETVSDSVEALSAADRDVVTIRAERGTAEEAAAYADEVAIAYGQLISEEEQRKAEEATQELERSRTELQSQITELEARLAADPGDVAAIAERDAAVSQLVSIQTLIDELDVNSALFGSGVELFQPASLPESPSSPRPVRNAAIAAFFAMLIAGGYALWQSVRSPRAVESGDPAPILGAPLLGTVPVLDRSDASPFPNAAVPRTVAAEAFQFILTSLDFAIDSKPRRADGRLLRSFVVTSVAAGDGKTLSAAGLAMAAAGDGRNLVLVDADERERGLSKLTGSLTGHGLTDLAGSNGAPLDDFTATWKISDTVALTTIAAGSRPQDTASFFRSDGFEGAMDRLEEHYEMVLVDSPPVLAVPETAEIAAEADGVILVVDRGVPLHALDDAVDLLLRAGTPVLGYIFNRSRDRHGGYGYGYSPRYGRRQRKREKATADAR